MNDRPRPIPRPIPRRDDRRPSPAPADGRGVLLVDVMAAALVVLITLAGFLWLDSSRVSALPAATPTASGVSEPSVVAHSTVAPTPAAADTSGPTMRYGDGTWIRTDPLPVPLWGAASVVLDDGRLMVIGGSTGTSSYNAVATAYLLDVESGRWSKATKLLQPRTYPMAVRLADGSVLVAGGSVKGQPLDTAERYFPSSGTWVAAGRLNLPRTQGTLTLLADGRVLATGGGIEGSPGYVSTASTEIFDPGTSTWTIAAPMAAPRALHTATLLADGEVLVLGGASIYHGSVGMVTTSAQIYDPKANRWRTAAALPHGLYSHSATLLRDGRVLVAGGWWLTADIDPSHAESQIYDPRTDTWTAAGSFNTARAHMETLALPDGRVLAIGGVDPTYRTLSSCEIYDPALGQWTPAGSLPAAVMGGVTGLLPDGRAVIAGGALDNNASRLTAVAAIYSAPPIGG